MDVRDHAHAHTTRVAALLQVIHRDLFFELIDLAHVSSPQSNNFGNKYASRACFSYYYPYVIERYMRLTKSQRILFDAPLPLTTPFFDHEKCRFGQCRHVSLRIIED